MYGRSKATYGRKRDTDTGVRTSVQRNKMYCTTQRSRAQAHSSTTPGAVDALLQYSTRALTSRVLHREQWRTGTATVGGGAQSCQTVLLLMVASGGVRARTMLAEASVGGGLVHGCSFWWWKKRTELIERCDGRGAIGWRCCVIIYISTY